MANFLGIIIRYKKAIYVSFILVAFFLILMGLATDFTYVIIDYVDYYSLLAEAFTNGQTHLLTDPSPELLALSDPYDPDQNASYKLHDASLYNGHYYLYWGPVPALLRIIFFNGIPSHLWLIFYVFLTSVFFYLILFQIRKQYFPKINRVVFNAIALLGIFNALTIYILSTTGIYYEAIFAAVAFTLAGIYSFLRSRESKNYLWILLSAIGFALALGTRISSLIILIPFVAYFFIQLIFKIKNASRMHYIKEFIIFVIPIFLCGILLLIYNYTRFDNFFEFGSTYQLCGLTLDREMLVAKKIFFMIACLHTFIIIF